ncbi:MAG: 50S ribosomal protein L18 [Candidatus Poribacteria bacterium]|nr:50S ribosomal protein L18 [Candidatus Poribacteria bacterium]
MDRLKRKHIARSRRKKRIRKKITGTSQRPRFSVFRSLKHIYVQIIDDEKGITVAAASTLSPELKDSLTTGGNANVARQVGGLIARKAKEHQIESVVFDRGGNLFHGRIKAVADAAREGGLRF